METRGRESGSTGTRITSGRLPHEVGSEFKRWGEREGAVRRAEEWVARNIHLWPRPEGDWSIRLFGVRVYGKVREEAA